MEHDEPAGRDVLVGGRREGRGVEPDLRHGGGSQLHAVLAAQTWTLRVGVFLLPLVYSPFTYDSFVLPKLLLARLLVLLLLLLFVARIAVTRTVVISRTPLDVPLLAFLASAALSSVFAENQNVAVFGTYARYDGLLTLFTFAALFWLSAQVVTDQAEARLLMRVLVAGGYVVAAVAIIQSLHDSIQQEAIAPAFGSLGNPNVLGAFLALVIALGVCELLLATSLASRIALVNVLVVSGIALLLSFSRSSWLAAAIGTAVVVISRPKRLSRLVLLVPLFALLVLALTMLEPQLGARITTFLDPNAIVGSRLGIWTDSLRVIASRPVLGYGPDNLGLVFPRFQTGDWGLAAGHIRQPIDKAHAELLQVAATQGVVGVAAYVLVLAAFLRTFWRARNNDPAVLAFGGWVAYQAAVQLNFTALASALPFWIFAAAAIGSCGAIRTRTLVTDLRPPLIVVPVAAMVAALTLLGVVAPYVADVRLRDAVVADYSGRPREAQQPAAQAHQLGPRESVYAVEIANIAFELGQWANARSGYRDAAALGTFNPLVYRNLALADRNLGLVTEAHEAARKAVELDPFDPANQALLAEFENKP